VFDIWVENKAFMTRLESLEKAVTAFFHLCFVADLCYPEVCTYIYIYIYVYIKHNVFKL